MESASNEIRQRLAEIKETSNGIKEPIENYSNYIKQNNNKYVLPEKRFAHRDSLLTELFRDKHFGVLYNVFILSFLMLFLNTFLSDYLKHRKINFGIGLIIYSFGKIHIALLLWIFFYSLTCVSFYCFKLWAVWRIEFFSKKKKTKLWDNLWIGAVVLYYLMSFRLSSRLISISNLPPASAVIIALEQTRMLMKVHSFIRTNVPKVVGLEKTKKFVLPSFRYFIFFTFVPTLIYRDEYPRTSVRRWSFICHRFLEVVVITMYFGFLIDRFLNPVYDQIGKRNYHMTEVVVLIIESALPGILFMITGFYQILHSWQNLFAELCLFGDRLFYQDWWTSTSYAEYYKKWNLVVHDWIYTYIYKDMYEYVMPGNRLAAKVVSLFISALVHEWVLVNMLGFFLPAMFIAFFVFGTLFAFIKIPGKTLGNILFWYVLSGGAGVLASLYTIEYYARANCDFDATENIFLPKFLNNTCILY